MTLVGLAVLVAAIALTLIAVGTVLGQPAARYAGLMVAATTFVPLPADTFVLQASVVVDPVSVAVLGGGANTLVVLIERRWILALVDHPWFERYLASLERNRLVVALRRRLFLGLLLGGATPLPFEPFRLVAVVADYPRWRYALATFVSRAFRYLLLALVGRALLDVGLLDVGLWITAVLFLLGVWRTIIWLVRRWIDGGKRADVG